MKENKTLRVAIYARVSTDEQSTDIQEQICKTHAERNGYEVVRIYKDVISGASTSRPEFNELLKDMREGLFNCILVTKLDRLGRSLQHLLSLFNEFNRRGVGFIAVTQNIDTQSATGRLQLHILGAFAEFERNLISERVKEGLKRRRKGTRGKDKKPRVRRWQKKPIDINPLF